MPQPDETVRYENDILYVGGIALTQFAGYEESERHQMPTGWSTSDALVLSSKADRFAKPIVSAGIFASNEEIVANPLRPIELVETGFGEDFAAGSEVLDEGSVEGSSHVCHLRIRKGAFGAESRRAETLVGTVIAVGTDRPSAGVVVDGPSGAPIERLTREIADALCAARPGNGTGPGGG